MSEVIAEEEVPEIAEKAHVGENFRLLDYSLKTRDKHGYLGIHLTLSARGEIHGRIIEDSFFVKTYRIPPAGQVDFIGETGMFNKEVMIYREIFRDLGNHFRKREWSPKYYFSKDRVLVLEDLSVRGYQIKTDTSTLDEHHLRVSLQAVAALHSACIIFEKKTGCSLDEKYPDCFREILYDENDTKSPSCMWKKRQIRDLMALVNFLDKYTPGEKQLITKFLPAATDKIYPLSKKSNRWLNVMVHGDMWINNLMFRSENGNPIDCRLVDFQFSRYAPPMHDVMHLLHLTTEKLQRDKIEENLFRAYYQSLRENLSSHDLNVDEILPWQTFIDSRNSYKLLAIIQSLLSMHYLLGGRRLQEESGHGDWSKTDSDPYLTRVPIENTKILINDEKYSKIVISILYELIDDYILNEERRDSLDISQKN